MLGRRSQPYERFTSDAPPPVPVDQPGRTWKTQPQAAAPPQPAVPTWIPDLVVRIPDHLTGHQALRDLTRAISRFRADVSQVHAAAAAQGPVRNALADVLRRFDAQLVDTFGLAAQYGTWPELTDGNRGLEYPAAPDSLRGEPAQQSSKEETAMIQTAPTGR